MPTKPESDDDGRQNGTRPSRRLRALAGSSVAAAHPADWEQHHWTSRVLHRVGEVTARSSAGVLAATLVILWVVVGIVYEFPTWWATALYSGTASVTLVMVFVIQHTHERQISAMQRKLDELIRSSAGADDGLMAVEEASDDHLQALTDRHVAAGQQMRE
jgi:low affinity Fe/Cu permease